MKRGALQHVKIGRLARLLSEERPTDRPDALGVVETICNHVAPDCAPQGDIGRVTNAELAEQMQTTRDPDLLVRSLVQAGFFEEHPEHRLLIHDWPDHADDAVKKKLVRKNLPFLTASGPVPVRSPDSVATLSRHDRDAVDTSSRRRRDDVGPPRAGMARHGKRSGSVPRSESTGRAETDARARAWHAVPAGELLTPKRIADAETEGLTADEAEAQWRAYLDHEFKRARVDVDKTWRNWCREFTVRKGNGRAASPPAKKHFAGHGLFSNGPKAATS